MCVVALHLSLSVCVSLSPLSEQFIFLLFSPFFCHLEWSIKIHTRNGICDHNQMEPIFFSLSATLSFDKKNADYYTSVCVCVGLFLVSLSCKQRMVLFSNCSLLFTAVNMLTMTEYYQERQRMNEDAGREKNCLMLCYNARPINYHSNYTSQLNGRRERERIVWARLGSLFSVCRSINMWMPIDVLKRLSKCDTFRFA